MDKTKFDFTRILPFPSSLYQMVLIFLVPLYQYPLWKLKLSVSDIATLLLAFYVCRNSTQKIAAVKKMVLSPVTWVFCVSLVVISALGWQHSRHLEYFSLGAGVGSLARLGVLFLTVLWLHNVFSYGEKFFDGEGFFKDFSVAITIHALFIFATLPLITQFPILKDVLNYFEDDRSSGLLTEPSVINFYAGAFLAYGFTLKKRLPLLPIVLITLTLFYAKSLSATAYILFSLLIVIGVQSYKKWWLDAAVTLTTIISCLLFADNSYMIGRYARATQEKDRSTRDRLVGGRDIFLNSMKLSPFFGIGPGYISNYVVYQRTADASVVQAKIENNNDLHTYLYTIGVSLGALGLLLFLLFTLYNFRDPKFLVLYMAPLSLSFGGFGVLAFWVLPFFINKTEATE